MTNRLKIIFFVLFSTIAIAGEETRPNNVSGTETIFNGVLSDYPIAPPFINVRINDNTYSFMLDTGAQDTVVDLTLKPFLGERFGPIELTGAFGKISSEAYAMPTILIGSNQLRGRRVVLLDLSFFHQATGVDYRGILGCPALDQWAVEFSYSKHQLEVLKSPFANPDGMSSLPVEFSANCPILTLQIGGTTSDFEVDTGIPSVVSD